MINIHMVTMDKSADVGCYDIVCYNSVGEIYTLFTAVHHKGSGYMKSTPAAIQVGVWESYL